jgi:ABC-type sugar transport system permease subunit
MATAIQTAPGPRTRARRWFAGFGARDTWAAFAFLSPWLFGFVVFTSGPMIASLILSFTDYSIIQTTHDVGMANFRTALTVPYVRTAMRDTFVYTAFFNQSTPYGTSASLMYGIYIFQQAFMFFKFGYASALAWLLFIVIGVITAIQIFASRRFVYYEGNK